MNPLTAMLVLQLAAAAPARQVAPVLAFPDPTLDDTVAYQGYQTRFFKDFAGNTVPTSTIAAVASSTCSPTRKTRASASRFEIDRVAQRSSAGRANAPRYPARRALAR